MFESEALGISLLHLSRRQLPSSAAPNEQPEWRALRLRVRIESLAAEHIKGIAVHGIVAGAAHQEIPPARQLEMCRCVVRVETTDELLLVRRRPSVVE